MKTGRFRRYRLLLPAALLLLALPPEVPAQEQDIVVSPGPLLWGAQVDLGLRNYLQIQEESNTTFWLHLGSWWGSDSYYRYPDYRIYDGALGAEDITSFNEWGLAWGLGFAQGLVPREAEGRDLLRVEAWYRAHFEDHLLADEADDLIVRSDLPDRRGVLLNKLFLGLIYDDTTRDLTSKQRDGLYAEISGEVAPAFLGNELVGSSDFARVNGTLRYYRSLLNLGGNSRLVPTLGFAAFGAADQLFALGSDHRRIPADARQAIGGLSPRTAMGGAIRGLDSGRYDANTKLVANLELRAFFPYALPLNMTPGLVMFLDGGYYRTPAGAPASSPSFSGFLAGTGIGVSIDLFDLATLVGYSGYNLSGENVDGRAWKPFFLGFGLHY